MNNLKKKYAFDIDLLKTNINELNFNTSNHKSKEAKKYFNFYNLEHEHIEHYFGYFLSNNKKIIAHVYKKKESKGTIFLLHGYLDHCGTLSKIISKLIKNNYSIACYDLQGHGLSDGERTAINNFDEYTKTFSDFLNLCKNNIPAPYHIISHSTGSAIIYNYLNYYKNIFEKIIFVAPLIRSQHWYLSKFFYNIAKLFLTKIPRVFRNVSSDKRFLNFIKHSDPLKDKKISLKWTQALYNWNKKINNHKILDKEILIIQGTEDVVVDWKYNLKFLRNKITSPIIIIIENGRHQLFNEDQKKINKINQIINNYLNKA